MATATSVDIAAAIAAEIDGHDFGLPLVVEWSYADFSLELEDDRIHVDVVPLDVDLQLVAVGAWEFACPCHVAVRRRLDETAQDPATGRLDKDTIARMAKLVQDIAEFFLPSQANQSGRALTDLPDAAYQPPRDPDGMPMPLVLRIIKEHLRTMRQFTGFFPLTYEIPKTLGG